VKRGRISVDRRVCIGVIHWKTVQWRARDAPGSRVANDISSRGREDSSRGFGLFWNRTRGVRRGGLTLAGDVAEKSPGGGKKGGVVGN
jgi:hypothetical protein